MPIKHFSDSQPHAIQVALHGEAAEPPPPEDIAAAMRVLRWLEGEARRVLVRYERHPATAKADD